MNRLNLIALVLMAWLSACDVRQLMAYESKDDELIRKSTHSIWCDPKSEHVNPVEAGQNLIDVSDRHASIEGPTGPSDWTWLQSIRESIGTVVSWLFASWFNVFALCMLLFVGILFFLVIRSGMIGNGYYGKSNLSDKLAREREKAKIQDLPFEIEQTGIGLLGQVEKHRADGDYSKAIIYLFSHVLVEMDRSRCIRLARGKTNRTYLRELRGQELLSAFTNQVVLAFEYAFFGKHGLSKEAFEVVWEQLPAFEQHLKQSESIATPTESFPKTVGGLQ